MTVEHSVPNQTFLSWLTPRLEGALQKRRQKGAVARAWEIALSPGYDTDRCCTYDLKAAMILCTRSNMSTFHHERGGAHEELMATGAGRVIFFSGVGNSKPPEMTPPSLTLVQAVPMRCSRLQEKMGKLGMTCWGS